jgi:CheY-like chemotaxis protein
MKPNAKRRPLEAARILLVEDDPGDVLITQESLAASHAGCEVTVVGDGAMALDYLHKRGAYAEVPTPHLILLDLNLPKVSGHEVLAHLDDDPELSSIPVVVLSTSSAEADVIATYALHGNAHVTKPVDLEDYQAAIRSIDEFFLSVAEVPQP